ncbi:hypothetical protein GGR52DRAFT_583583 [Hypoxylon sp. FL1284]|nr:hypothetical protein GGR52DRAFT_583583 [Hypoxylon sp. FL1284]
MAKIQRSNYLPDIQHLLDAQNEPDSVALEVECRICGDNKLDISRSAREHTLSSLPPTKHLEAHRHLPRYMKHGLERTVALPCGHVFGDRCIADLRLRGKNKKPGKGGDLACPSCGQRAVYAACGHAIRPARVPVDGHAPVRDAFPLTAAEAGGGEPRCCAECTWQVVRATVKFALADDCAMCRQTEAQLAVDRVPADAHAAHRARHLGAGLTRTLDDVAALVWPELATRETQAAAARRAADGDRRRAQVSLLRAMILSALEDTIWYRTRALGKGGGRGRGTGTAAGAGSLTKEQLRRHAQAVADIEQSLLDWLMESARETGRMW